MKLRLQKTTLWAILAGISYVLCFPRYDLPALSVLFLPSLLFAVHGLRRPRQAVLLGFLLSSMVAIGGFHWIIYVAQNFGEMPLPLAVGLLLLFCLVAAPQMVAFTLGGYYIRFSIERLPLSLRPLFWAALYTGLEYLARFVKIFPENLGNTLLAFPYLAQAASLGGVSLLSFLALWPGASLAYLRKDGPRAWPSVAASLALLAAVAVWGKQELRRLEERPVEILRVGFVQPNMEEVEKIAQRTGGAHAIETIVQHLVDRTLRLSRQEPKPDLIVWPETAYPIVFPTGSHRGGYVSTGYANLVKAGAVSAGVPVLFGGYESDQADYNSAILLGAAKGQVEATYRKEVLLIFGEYIPFSGLFPSLKNLNPQMGDFGRGPGSVPMPFEFKGRPLPLGVNICYEAILPDYMRGFAEGGARLFVNLTKDSWYGPTFEPWQHLQLSVLRSVEHHIPMVRVTNTGLSGLILPSGKVELISQPFEEAFTTLPVPVPLTPSPTPYTLLGDWFAWSCLAYTFACLTWCFRRRLS